MDDYLYTESSLIGGASLQTHIDNLASNNLIMHINQTKRFCNIKFLFANSKKD